MKLISCALLLSSISLAHAGTTNSVNGSGSARTSQTSYFTFSGSAKRVPLTATTYRYSGGFSLQGYVGHDYVTVLIPSWTSGQWSGNQSTLAGTALVTVLHSGRTLHYHGTGSVLFVDNNHGQNSAASGSAPCDCVCLSWKDSASSFHYDLLGTVQRGGSVTVK